MVPWRTNKLQLCHTVQSQTMWTERVKWKSRKVHLIMCPTLQISRHTVGPYMTDHGSCIIVPRWGYCGTFFWHSNQINLWSLSYLHSSRRAGMHAGVHACVCVCSRQMFWNHSYEEDYIKETVRGTVKYLMTIRWFNDKQSERITLFVSDCRNYIWI